MMDFDAILKNEKKLKIMTGISRDEFDLVVVDFEKKLNQIRKPKGLNSGAPSKLSLEEKLLMTLIYYRHYQEFDFIGVMFNVDGSTVKRWLDSCEVALESVLEKKNLSHLIPRNQDPSLRPSLTPRQKSISMALNSLSEDRKMQMSKKIITQEKRKDIPQKFSL